MQMFADSNWWKTEHSQLSCHPHQTRELTIQSLGFLNETEENHTCSSHDPL